MKAATVTGTFYGIEKTAGNNARLITIQVKDGKVWQADASQETAKELIPTRLEEIAVDAVVNK